MFYTVYQIINKINGKVYVGKHMTKDLDDGYMGSGKLICRAIKKHGKENFKKEILHVFDNEEAMNAKEAELVVVSEETYNLCDGGKGGWTHVNRVGLNGTLKALEKRKKLEVDSNWKQNWKDKQLEGCKNRASLPKDLRSGLSKQVNETYKQKHGRYPFEGKKHTTDVKNRISEKAKLRVLGSKNPSYGTMWITNGIDNRKIKKTDEMPYGWHRGRLLTSQS